MSHLLESKRKGRRPSTTLIEYQLVSNTDAEELLPDAMSAKQSAWRQQGLRLVQSTPFQLGMGFAILANSIVIGLETEYHNWIYWDWIENSFLILFLLELVVRMVVVRPSVMFSIYNEEFIGNTFDTVIVGLGIFDAVCVRLFTKKSKDAGLATLFRLVRLLRILRIFKILRFLKQLYLLAYGLVDAFQSVFWVTVLMLFFLYVCSIVLVRTVGRLPETDDNYVFLNRQYGSILRSMLSLFELMAQPDMQPYHGLREDYPGLTLFLITWIVFGSFGMVALLTGVISEAMLEKNTMRTDAERLERQEQRHKLATSVGAVFDSIPPDKLNDEDEASFATVKALLIDVAKVLAEHQIQYNKQDMQHVVNVMDTDESGGISKEEFVVGLVSIAEGIRPMSIAELFHSIQLVKSRVGKVQAHLHDFEQTIERLNLRDHLISLESKVTGLAETQFKAAADSALVLKTVQSLAARFSHEQVQPGPKENSCSSGSTSRPGEDELRFSEMPVPVSELQNQLKKLISIYDKLNANLSCIAGSSSRGVGEVDSSQANLLLLSQRESRKTEENVGCSGSVFPWREGAAGQSSGLIVPMLESSLFRRDVKKTNSKVHVDEREEHSFIERANRWLFEIGSSNGDTTRVMSTAGSAPSTTSTRRLTKSPSANMREVSNPEVLCNDLSGLPSPGTGATGIAEGHCIA